MTIVMITWGILTGSADAKYFSQVLLGLTEFKTFPVTENLMPDGSVTVVNELDFSGRGRDDDQLTILSDFLKICNDFTG